MVEATVLVGGGPEDEAALARGVAHVDPAVAVHGHAAREAEVALAGAAAHLGPDRASGVEDQQPAVVAVGDVDVAVPVHRDAVREASWFSRRSAPVRLAVGNEHLAKAPLVADELAAASNAMPTGCQPSIGGRRRARW
jgi:hypothetical protein